MAKLVQINVAAEVLVRARRGDPTAEALLYAVAAPAAFALIRRLVGAGAHAEDLFQETMMSFYEQLASYRAEAPIGAWLRQIAVSKCLMHLRSPWQRGRLQLDAGWQEGAPRNLIDFSARPTPLAEQLDIDRALASLPPTACAVVWLFEVESYMHAQIGRAFRRSASFSKSQLARTHRRLREWFEPSVEPPACTSI